MRVVWINKSPWRKAGPIVYMGLLNAMSMAWRGWHTDLFVGAGEASDTVQDLADFYGLAPDPRLAVHRIGGGTSRAVYRAALAQIDAHCAAGEPVLAITRELGCLPALLRLRKRHPRLRILHEAHDYYLSRRHQPRRDWSAWRRQWAERLLLPRCDGLILLTDYQRALYQQCLPGLPMRALPLGTLRFAAADDEARRRLRRVAYVGHLHAAKGLGEMFALAQRLAAHGISLHCYGGHPKQVAALAARAAAEGLGDALCFQPFMRPRELHGVLAHSVSVGLVPLADTFYNRYLTCPVKALDALSHGLPIVASDLPGMRELLQDAGCYAAPDAPGLASRIAHLLDDADGYAQAAAASRQRAMQLSWERRAQAIVDFAVALGDWQDALRAG